VLDDAMLESLEELLITADMGVETALKLSARLAEGRFGKRVSTAEIKRALAGEIAAILEPVARPLPLYAKRPQVVLVVGVNGSGKTTTIGKLASQLKAAGKSVVIAAGDTFRAAAVAQLKIWGERSGCRVVAGAPGADAAGLAYEALEIARREGHDLLLIDTAGRLHNKADLMAELQKILRVLKKLDASAPHDTLLVLDATIGQNAHAQVAAFKELVAVSGLALTKLDGSARGGVVVALAEKFGLPVHAIGVGEGLDDLRPFQAHDFANSLMGIEN
jgi:fused signal recognition particle receptor